MIWPGLDDTVRFLGAVIAGSSLIRNTFRLHGDVLRIGGVLPGDLCDVPVQVSGLYPLWSFPTDREAALSVVIFWLG